MSPRRLAQPGPALEPRIESVAGHALPLALTLAPGLSLLEAVTRAVYAAGFDSATLELEGGTLAPFSYVLPAPAPDATHAAYYSRTHMPAAGARLERACITLGRRTGQPWLHCHAVWEEAAGRRGGHVLPEETLLASPVAARAWGLSGIALVSEPDAETNFTVFHPIPAMGPPRPGARPAAAVRIRPNEDAAGALAAVASRHGLRCPALRGSLGSLIGARFAGGGAVEDYATEMLFTGDGLGIALADMQGRVHDGTLLPGENPVCITIEALLVDEA
jgi:predicted DNA-binding protein with PD1-like motif